MIDDIGAGNHAAEDAVAPAVGVRGPVIEKSVVGDIDEELRGGGMRVGGARHGNGVALVLEPVLRFVFDRGLSRLLLEVWRKSAALDHESVDDAMEHRVVEMPSADIFEKVGDGFGCLRGIELDRDRTVIGVQDDHGKPNSGRSMRS